MKVEKRSENKSRGLGLEFKVSSDVQHFIDETYTPINVEIHCIYSYTYNIYIYILI